MADRFAAEIEIGGAVPRSLMDDLLGAAQDDGAGVDWGNGAPDTIEELVDGVAETETLWLCNDQASYGEFPELEQFLVAHGIAFDRRSEAGCECGPELVRFRPGMEKPDSRELSSDGVEVVDVPGLHAVLDALSHDDVALAKYRLEEILGRAFPPLEPFRIVENT